MSVKSYADLLQSLFGDYEHRHSLTVIEHVATQCRHQLAGHTPEDSFMELLEQPARQPLDDLPTDYAR